VECWGDDSAGQLQVPSGPLHHLSQGGSAMHTCAILGDADAGEPVCWGLNTSGQLQP
jgi:hypothetical protein